MTVLDSELNIIYINDTASKIFHRLESDIKTEVPAFDACNLIGKSIDVFHKNPSHQRGILENLASTFYADISLAQSYWRVIASPIVDNNKMIGIVIEWRDLADQKMLENEIQTLVDASLEGDLSKRINLSSGDQIMMKLSEGINNMVNISESIINDTVHVLSAVSQGNLSEKIEADYKGTFNQLKINVNETVKKTHRERERY